MTRQEICDTIDARLTATIGQITAAQTAYKNANGKYAQILDTHTAPPEDGVEVAPDRLDTKPHYQQQTARQLAGPLLRASQLSSLKIDQYRTPDNEFGFVVTLTTKINGEIWTRAVNVGPETWRNKNWSAE